MKPPGLHVSPLGGAFAAGRTLFDPELLAMYALLLAFLVSGGIVIYVTYRWYRRLKNAPSSKTEDLDQLARVLQDDAELAPEEKERLRAALQRQKDAAAQPPKEQKDAAAQPPREDDGRQHG
jgi:hypothetical protein